MILNRLLLVKRLGNHLVGIFDRIGDGRIFKSHFEQFKIYAYIIKRYKVLDVIFGYQ